MSNLGLCSSMRKFLIGTTLISLMFSIPNAMAMGSGDKFQDAQTGLTFQIFKPANTAHLKGYRFKMLSCGADTEQWIAAYYGKTSKGPALQILENSAATPCYNSGMGVTVATTTINKAPVRFVAYCDPASQKQWKNCSIKDIAKYGGYAHWDTAPTKNLKATTIEIIAMGLSYQQILDVAKSLKPLP